MKHTGIYTTTILLLALSITGYGQEARDLLKSGVQQYDEQNYPEAAQQFQEAADAVSDESKLDKAIAYYDAAAALYRQGEYEKAADMYARALQTSDLNLQSKAYYNSGNTLMQLAQQQQSLNMVDEAKKQVDQAITMYENSIALASDDMSAKVNYELAVKKQEELKQLQQQQQQQNQDNQDQNEDQQDQQQQQNQQNQQDQQNQQEENQDQQQQEEQQQEQNQQQQNQEGQDQQDEQQAQPQPQDPSEEMTEEEAEMILDAMKQEEQAKRDQMRKMHGQPVPVDKNW